MNARIRKYIVLLIVAIALMTSACSKTLGGTTITVNMPKNDCGVIACTTETQTDIIVIE